MARSGNRAFLFPAGPPSPELPVCQGAEFAIDVAAAEQHRLAASVTRSEQRMPDEVHPLLRHQPRDARHQRRRRVHLQPQALLPDMEIDARWVWRFGFEQ